MRSVRRKFPQMLATAALFWATTASPQARPSELGAVQRDLPVVEMPSRVAGRTMVLFVSGDGGWAKIEKEMSAEFNDHGVSVVGLDLREYLRRTARTPEDVGRDASRIFRVYSDTWSRHNVVLLGFSRGAGITPFVLTRLPPDLRSRLALTAFVGLPQKVNLTFHWIDVIRDVKRPDDIPVLPELAKAPASKGLCFFGVEETESACRTVPTGVRRIELPGGHHLQHAYRALADSVLAEISR